MRPVGAFENSYFDKQAAGLAVGIGSDPDNLTVKGLNTNQMTGDAASDSMADIGFGTDNAFMAKANTNEAWYYPQLIVFAGSDNSTIKADSLLSVILTYTVTFNSAGGSAVPAVGAYQAPVAKPADPTLTGYAFAGWYADSALMQAFDFSTVITSDITLYAKWEIKTYTVTFDSNSGSTVEPVGVTYNTAVSKPTDPTRTGYTFGGWYKDTGLTQAYDFSIKITSDITLYAKWSAVAGGTGVTGGAGVIPNPDTGNKYPLIPICVAGIFSFKKRKDFKVI